MSMVMKVSGGVSREMLWRCFLWLSCRASLSVLAQFDLELG
jgi:hypothetical protein